MQELKVQPIKDGTVIDHITPGTALKVLKIIGLPSEKANIMSILINVQGKNSGTKDIVKLEEVELAPREVDKIALIAPKATINIIRNYEVVEKREVELQDMIRVIVRCANPNCISNKNEPIDSQFRVLSKTPPRLRCVYCERELEDIYGSII